MACMGESKTDRCLQMRSRKVESQSSNHPITQSPNHPIIQSIHALEKESFSHVLDLPGSGIKAMFTLRQRRVILIAAAYVALLHSYM